MVLGSRKFKSKKLAVTDGPCIISSLPSTNFDSFFSRDVEDEEAWIREKEPIISSSNRGKDLIGVQNLIKKHTSMSGEINHHEPKLEQVINVTIICPLYCYNYLSQ